jgi:FixJ family two-component response regulator
VVIIVDDEVSLREAVENLLRSVGVRVETFASAEAFLASPRRRRARCLILDVALPGMNGLDLLDRLLQERAAVPCIIVTANEDDDGQIRSRALRAGASAVLRKPFQEEELLTAVRAALEG